MLLPISEDVVVAMTVVVEVVNPIELVVVDVVVTLGVLVVVNVVEPVEFSSCTTTQYRVFTPYREHHPDPVFEKN
jgi:hypothetical protein